MRYAGLIKIGKKAFCVNFSLLQTLKITTKEAILLQQIDFVNNKRDYLTVPMTILAKITSMSRGHLYRCLKKLKNLNLITISEEGIRVTDYYKSIKNADFLENHNKQHLISKHNEHFSRTDVQNVACQNVACSDKKQSTKLTQHKEIYTKQIQEIESKTQTFKEQKKQNHTTRQHKRM